jgi:hypothetical protein
MKLCAPESTGVFSRALGSSRFAARRPRKALVASSFTLEQLEERLLLSGGGGGGLLPILTIDDVSVIEGGYYEPDGTINDEPNIAVFTVTLSEPVTWTVTVDYETVELGGGAREGFLDQSGNWPACAFYNYAPSCADFLGAAGTLTFAPGETTKTIEVTIVPDIRDESDQEEFGVHHTRVRYRRGHHGPQCGL